MILDETKELPKIQKESPNENGRFNRAIHAPNNQPNVKKMNQELMQLICDTQLQEVALGDFGEWN